MPRKRQGISLYGPYKHRDRWRVLRRAPSEPDQWVPFDTEEEGRAYVAEARRRLEGRRVSEAATAYVESMKRRGCADESIAFTEGCFKRLFQKDDELVTSITAARARALVDALAGSVATRRETLKLARRWWRWMSQQGWVRGVPFDLLTIEGVRRRGKPQLTGDEAARLFDWCIARAHTSRGAVAVMAVLLMGMRRNEVRGIAGRDVDRGGSLLWVRGTKTENAMRRLEVPDVLAPHLARLAADAGAGEPVFGAVSKVWLARQIRVACDGAGVPVVAPHGLRGTFATLATTAGATSHLVAQSLGHGNSTRIAEAHYIRREASQTAATGRVLGVISGGRSG